MRRRYNFKKIFVPKIFFITIVFILTLLLLLCRVVYISLFLSKDYEVQAITQHTARVIDRLITPKRGEILDRNGEKLATSVTIYDVIFDIKVFMSEDSFQTDTPEEREKYLRQVSEIIDVPYEELNSYIQKDSNGELIYNVNYKKIKKDLSYEQGKKFEESNLPSSFYLETKSKRLYPYNNVASHVIGLIRGDNANSYWGIEKYYNDYMIGEYGRYYRTYDENGLIVTNNIPEVNGDTVTLTIDTTIQTMLDELTEKYGEMYNAENTSIIVMEPNTGEILGMSNYVSFNNNYPSSIEHVNGTTFKQEYEELETVQEKSEKIMNSWRNFAITDPYEPGSVFKPMVLASALEEGIVDSKNIFYCPGYIVVGTNRIPCWYENGHGEQNIVQAIANSCNPAIIEINQMLGREKFYEYQKDFGFGELTGIDLPAENNASAYIYSVESLNVVELATSAMGQGFTATAIQNTTSFASLINGGKLLQPYVVSHISGEDGTTKLINSPTVIKQTISKETSDMMRTGLQAVISPTGTGKNAIIEGYNIGGKTGTAQQGDRSLGELTLSFIAYFPVEEPKYIINAVVHKPRPYILGVTSPVPLGKEIIEGIISYKNIPPSSVYNITDEDYLSRNKLIISDYVGRNIVDVSKEINNYGYNFEITGTGDTIINQIPTADTEMSKDATIFLYVGDNDIDNNTTENDINTDNIELNVVPSLIGLTESEAKRVLDNMDFTYKVVVNTTNIIDTTVQEEIPTQENENELVEHKVEKQMPSEGAVLPEGTQIRLIVE